MNFRSVLIIGTIGIGVSGCSIIDSASQIKANVISQGEEIQANIKTIRENITEKKRLIDEKLEQIAEVEQALSDLLGSESSLASDITGGTPQYLESLYSQLYTLEEEVGILEDLEQERLHDSSSFSIE